MRRIEIETGGGFEAQSGAVIAAARIADGDASRSRVRQGCNELVDRLVRVTLSPRPTDWRLERSPTGAPVLVLDGRKAALGVGISHSRNWLAVGLSSGAALGLDVEALRPIPRMEAIAGFLGWPTQASSVAEFWKRWTLVEAFAKQRGGSVLDKANRRMIPLADVCMPGFLFRHDDVAAYCEQLGSAAMLSVVLGRRAVFASSAMQYRTATTWRWQ